MSGSSSGKRALLSPGLCVNLSSVPLLHQGADDESRLKSADKHPLKFNGTSSPEIFGIIEERVLPHNISVVRENVPCVTWEFRIALTDDALSNSSLIIPL